VTSEGDAKHRHLLIDPDDLDTVISTKWLIDGLVPLQEISLVFGPPKNLKTFLVLALLLCVATGREFFGRKVHRAKVLYIIGEGTNAFLGRIKAWQKLNDVPSLEKHFKYDRRMINLFADDGVDCAQAVFVEMQAQGFRPDVVAIDTLGRAMGGAKETTEDFNKIFATLDTMAQDYWPRGDAGDREPHPEGRHDLPGAAGDRRRLRQHDLRRAA
jgi:RecA-family ATPase